MSRSTVVVLTAVVLVALSSVAPVATAFGSASVENGTTTPTVEAAATDEAVLVVAKDGSAEYESIQAAVDDAAPGDTVKVRPGTYQEQVTVSKNITVVAPEGATLDGSRFDEFPQGFRIKDDSVPVIEGFVIQNYAFGVNAEGVPMMGVTSESNWDTGWTVRNLTIRNCSEEAIRAGNSESDWLVENVYIEDCRGGVSTFGSRGDWTIRNTIVHDAEFDGIGADSDGDWTVRNVSLSGDTSNGIGTGISGGWFSGNGTIIDTTIRNFYGGVSLDRVSGNVTITDSIITNITHPSDDPAYNGVAIRSENVSGQWQIHDSIIRNYSRYGINATDANPTVNATGNWWGPNGPKAGNCVGNVRCNAVLASRPAAGAVLNAPGAPDHKWTGAESTAPLETTPAEQPTSTSESEIKSEDESTESRASTDGDTAKSGFGPVPLVVGVIVVVAAGVGGSLGLLFVYTRK